MSAVSPYFIGFVIDRAWIGADPKVPTGEMCHHSHRSQETAANCARRAHKRLSAGGRITGLRAYTARVLTDGQTEAITGVDL